MLTCNEIKITGIVKTIYPLITTVNKLNVVRFVLEHQSILEEYGQLRKVYCKMFCMILGAVDTNDLLLEQTVKVDGFISANSQQQIVLHVNKIEKLN